MRDQARAVQVKMAGAIVVARDRAGLSQTELAARLGIEAGTLSTYETATRKVPVTLIPKLAEALSRPIGYFFGEPDPRGLSEEEQGIIGQLRSIESPTLKATAVDSISKQLQAIIESDRKIREQQVR